MQANTVGNKAGIVSVLQQDHVARLATSRLEGMDFSTDCYLTVTVWTGEMQRDVYIHMSIQE